MTAPHRTAAAAVALLLLAGCSGGDKAEGLEVTGTVTASGAPGSQTASLDMTDDLTFDPNVVKAQVGNLNLSIKNVGKVPHNLVFDDESLGKTGTVKGGATATLSVRLSKAGSYTFTCTFHPGMDGKVEVTG